MLGACFAISPDFLIFLEVSVVSGTISICLADQTYVSALGGADWLYGLCCLC